MYKVAIIGAGYMAKEHIKVLQDIHNVEITGIYSRTFIKAENLAINNNIKHVAKNIEDLYNITKADVVIIAVSVDKIFEISSECFKYPWICFIEKPAGYNLNEALSLNNIANNWKRKVYVALNRRHYSSTIKALTEVNLINSPRIIKIFDQEDTNDPIRIGHPPHIIYNWMYANSIHLIDYFTIFCRGNLLNISHEVEWNSSNPFYILAKLEYDSGDIGIYEAIWNAPSPWSVNIITKEKRFEMSPLEKISTQNYGSRSKIELAIDEWDIKFKPGLRLQAQILINSLNKNESSSLPTLSDSIKTMTLINKIYKQ
jgi:predicted dehydrogenase